MPSDIPGREIINPWLIAIAVMSSTFMEVLDTTVVNVSLPHIAGSLSSSTDEATWTLTSYLVANAIILPMADGWRAVLAASACLWLRSRVLRSLPSSAVWLRHWDSLSPVALFKVHVAEACSRCRKPSCWSLFPRRNEARQWPSGRWALWLRPCWVR